MEKKILVGCIVASLLLMIFVWAYFILRKTICYTDEKGKLKCDIMWFISRGKLLQEGSPLVQAIHCSYYRCWEGCESKEVKEIRNDALGFNCLSFCDESFDINGDKKICDDEAKEHPIVITLDDETTISIEDIRFSTCIMEARDKDEAKMHFIVMDMNAIKEKKEDKCSLFSRPEKSIVRAVINPGKYYVWSYSLDFWGRNNRLAQTVVWTSPPEKVSDCCSDCSCSSKEMCEYCRREGLNDRCYFDDYYGTCNSLDAPPSCSPYYPSTLETNCKSFCEEACDNDLSRCYCDKDHCAAECGCDAIKACEDYSDPIACRLDQCKVDSCEWSYVPTPGKCFSW